MNSSRAALAAVLILSCASTRAGQPAASAVATAPTTSGADAGAASPPSEASLAAAQEFLARVNKELYRLVVKQGTADWIRSTYLTDDTERASAAANDELLAFQGAAIQEAGRYAELPLDADSRRQLLLLRLAGAGPSDPAHRLELTTLAARLEGMYGKGKWCGAGGKAKCRDLEELSELMRTSRDPAALLDAWTGWRTVAKPMRPLYERFVALQNEGARDIGFADEGALWRAGYDMPPEAFEKETERLWSQVKPLYDDLHCYVRARLQKHYGKELVPDGKPIPAHLLGDMWAQEWNNLYDLVEPYPNQPKLDVTPAMVAQGWDWKRMVQTAESFYTSLGLDPLPQTFWERSMFQKPRDREVVCHASAWNVLIENDLRIKMCIKVEEADLQTLHHELGHNYYEHSYYKLPVMLYHGGANDGFHEAIGDSLVLSMTPAYLKKLGLLDTLPGDDRGLVDVQMKDALSSIAFLPFAKLIDQWRWDVFSGKTRPSEYNRAWWELRRRYQGVAPPVGRGEDDFDPGAKYHVAANVPYTRYFVARILQFQFHRALCQAAGFKGPLYECSVYGSKQAGARLRAMLELGQKKPWQEALFAMTGSREMDASAILDYFAPLRRFLEQQNQGRRCGW